MERSGYNSDPPKKNQVRFIQIIDLYQYSMLTIKYIPQLFLKDMNILLEILSMKIRQAL